MTAKQIALYGFLLTVLLIAWGCEPAAEGKLHRPIDAPPPKHPAMAERVEPSQAEHAAHGSSSLPPGHPPVATSNSTPGPSTADTTRTPPVTETPTANEGRITLGPISFDAPKGLVRESPANTMRLAQFRLPKAEGNSEDGMLTVSRFGGTVEGNVQRWGQQFVDHKEPQITTHDVPGSKVTTVRIDGTYRGMSGPFSGNATTVKEEYRLWGAVVPLSDSLVFFKATGPKATLLRWEQSLDDMARSLEVKE